ncbi:hypothetical protein D9615_002978 [Tricholomella constricta]|uniref:Uncharacterized protein n=1 Tax=Tricholomella constricta TaxID=117010 RepID=A0A8H5M6F6_9AGAR|nr:hypothetical protein D9615_002978 [Tricholomella constricta]
MSSTSPSMSPRLFSTPSSTSPPRTPVDLKPRLSSATPPSDDSSIIDDLSFDYVFDNEGNYVRLSKGSSSKSNTSSPPTPQDNLPQALDPPLKPSPPPVARRSSLSRSESAYPVLVSTAAAPQSDAQPPRSFQRVASGPALSNNKARPLPRRVTMEESNKQRPLARLSRATDLLQHEKENIVTSDSEQGHDALHPARIIPSRTGYSRSGQLSDPHQRQIMPGPNRAGRIMKSSSSAGSALRFADYSIPESHSTADIPAESETDLEDEPVHPPAPLSTPFPSSEPLSDAGLAGDTELVGPTAVPTTSSIPSITTTSRQRSYVAVPSSCAREPDFPSEVALTLSTGTRPRRSASLSDALSLHDAGYGHHHHQQHQQQLREQYQNMRSGSAANDIGGGPRRVTIEEREREIRRYRRDAEEVERRQAEHDHYYDPQSNQETHQQQPPTLAQRQYGHKRRDSDTLRSMPASAGLASPTLLDSSSRTGGISPSGVRQGRISPPGAKPGRVSPPGKVSPPSTRGRTSPPSTKSGRVSPPVVRGTGRVSPAPSSALAKHRRSPTAPETVVRDDQYGYQNGNDREREREREERRIQQQALHEQQQQQQYMRAAPAAPVPPPPVPQTQQRHFIVNKKVYARLDMIGKGGSSRVFRVLASAGGLYAIKRVSLDKTDAEAMSGYMNEIALLKRLDGNSRIIRLIDSEVRSGPGGSKGNLMLVMECGEVDLARLISERVHDPLNMVWVAYYWQQMLQAVHVIHEEKIVHSDLKPANFVIVRGQLKLIDFGIANAIANDTTNIQRDHQIGTVNYMSPEAIELPDGMRRLKVGRPSDIWSLGCILYQMIYGQPPFQHLSVYQKMKAIPDLAHIIEFPEYSVPLAPAPKATSSGGASGATTPPKRLDHLKRKVRPDVIEDMKSCLCRNPKERSTIPQLLEQDWLAMKEPEAPPVKDLLASDETVINPYYMRQLLQYGIKLGEAQNADMSPEALLREAEVLITPSSTSAKPHLTPTTSLHQALHHPNIVSLLSAFSTVKETFQVLELCSVGNLSQFLRARPLQTLQELELRGVTKSLADALTYLRKELVIHGDINPSSILLTTDYGVKLTNFKYSIRLPSKDSTTSSPCRASDYAAPEIASGGTYGFAADIWSLGCVMVYCLTGMAPFNTSSSNSNSKLPVGTTTYGQVTILPSHSVLVDFRESQRRKGFKGNEVFVVNPDGTEISVYSAPHLSSPCCLIEPTQIFSIEHLPSVYWKQYNDAARLIDQIKQRTPLLVVYSAGAKCTLMANTPRGEIEVLFNVPPSLPNKLRSDIVPSLRLRFSRRIQSIEFARHVSDARGEEWTKKVIVSTLEPPYISTKDWKSLEQAEKDALHDLTRFVETCDVVEGLLMDNAATSSLIKSIPATDKDKGIIDPVKHQKPDHLQTPESSRSTSTIKSNISFLNVASRPSKLSVTARSTPDLTDTIQLVPQEFSTQEHDISAKRIPSDVNSAWHDDDLNETMGTRGIQTRFIPFVGWCIRYASRVSQGGRYRMMFLDGVALDIDVDEDWVEFKSQSGETTMHNIRNCGSNRKIGDRLKVFEEFVSMFDNSQEE